MASHELNGLRVQYSRQNTWRIQEVLVEERGGKIPRAATKSFRKDVARSWREGSVVLYRFEGKDQREVETRIHALQRALFDGKTGRALLTEDARAWLDDRGNAMSLREALGRRSSSFLIRPRDIYRGEIFTPGLWATLREFPDLPPSIASRRTIKRRATEEEPRSPLVPKWLAREFGVVFGQIRVSVRAA